MCDWEPGFFQNPGILFDIAIMENITINNLFLLLFILDFVEVEWSNKVSVTKKTHNSCVERNWASTCSYRSQRKTVSGDAVQKRICTGLTFPRFCTGGNNFLLSYILFFLTADWQGWLAAKKRLLRGKVSW